MKIHELLIYLALALLAACATVAPYRFTNFTTDYPALDAMRQKRVAVLDFDNASEGYEAGAALSDEFSLQLGKVGRFELVERKEVTELFKEQDLDPERLDAATAVEIGKMLGAHGVIMGTVTDYWRGKVGLNVRLVAVETGSIVWQASDALRGSDPRVQALVSDRQDKQRLTESPEYLGQVLCGLMAESLK